MKVRFCPTCPTQMSPEKGWLDTATLKETPLWICPTCLKLFSDEDLEEWREHGINAMLLLTIFEDYIILYGDDAEKKFLEELERRSNAL